MIIDGTVAIVTGGASGLGAAVVRRLADDGATPAIFDMNAEAGVAVAEAVAGTFYQVDVTSETSVAEAVTAVTSDLGTPRILVNCAGIAPPAKVVDREGAPQPLAAFSAIVNVNLIGTFNVLAQVAAKMQATDPIEEERGIIINTASVAAFEGQIGQAAYAASKGGVVSMALPIARELARHGIRVNTVAPGLFLTPLLESLPQDAQDSLGQQVPFPSRLGHPAEFAKLVADIVTNPMINAEVIRLDGAIRMAAR
ncbi:MAG: SDR family NAD(P)-dependent oxidoreductase [Pseudomonadota bacterium]